MLGFNLSTKVEYEKGMKKLPFFRYIEANLLSKSELWFAFSKLDVDLQNNELIVKDGFETQKVVSFAFYCLSLFMVNEYILPDNVSQILGAPIAVTSIVGVAILVSSELLVAKKISKLNGYKFPDSLNNY